MSEPTLTLERIYPQQLDAGKADDRATLDIHLERYQFASAHLRGERILDMACGCGYGSAWLAQQHPERQITGVDIDPAAIAYAQARYQLPNLRYVCADAERFGRPDKSGSLERTDSPEHIDSLERTDNPERFDSIVSLETIEHLPHPRRLIANFVALLAPGGQIIASVPTSPTLDGNPSHLHDFTSRTFRALFAEHGLRPVARLAQTQRWQFRGLFRRRTEKQYRSEGVGNAVLGYYRRHPLYLFKRVRSILGYGFSNRYLTCCFRAEP